MNELKYEPNSNKYKKEQKEGGEERKKMEKVVSGPVKTKHNGIRKFTDVFIAEDVKSVKEHLVADVLIPNAKKIIVDLIQDGISLLVYGKTSVHKSNTPAARVSYRSFYDKPQSERKSVDNYKTNYSYMDITLDTRNEAEEVMDRLNEAIAEYGSVSVADLYDLVGVSGEFTDNKYGWFNLRTAEIQRVRDGYLLKLPRAVALN